MIPKVGAGKTQREREVDVGFEDIFEKVGHWKKRWRAPGKTVRSLEKRCGTPGKTVWVSGKTELEKVMNCGCSRAVKLL